jgi:hypothetical protein
MAASIAQDFVGLPIEDLIVSPIVGMAKGQAKLNKVTWDYISEVAFVTENGKTVARSLDVELNRIAVDGATGEQTPEVVHSRIPMLPLVPLPSLAITNANIDFTMEVQTQNQSTDTTKASAGSTVTGGYKGWGFSVQATVTGKVSTTKENIRKTDNTAKYTVSVTATQLPPTEGMLKLSDYLTKMMEPSNIPLPSDKN